MILVGSMVLPDKQKHFKELLNGLNYYKSFFNDSKRDYNTRKFVFTYFKFENITPMML